MPWQQVYGKRSRPVYAPFDALSSPNQPVGKTVGNNDIKEITVGLKTLGLEERRSGRAIKTQHKRTALRQRSANIPIEPIVHLSPGKKRDRRRKKSLTQDLDTTFEKRNRDEGVVEPDLEVCSGTVSRTHSSPTAVDERHEKENSAPVICEADIPDGEWSSKRNELRIQLSSQPLNHLAPISCELPTIYSEHCSLLLPLSSHSLTAFSEWSAQLANHFEIAKIAEASFGEVYRLSLLRPLPGLSSDDESVLKIIALQPPPATLPKDRRKRKTAKRKIDAMSKPEDVASEVRLLQRMSTIPGFTNFRDVRILQGRPPIPFVNAFHAYNDGQKAKGKDSSCFPDPGKKTSYTEDQLWAVVEMQDAGTDLERLIESGKATTMPAVWDIFWEVALSLGKGEEGARFEHRDLHLGNICVRSSPSRDPAMLDVKKKLGFTGFETTIIDYTISRASMDTEDPDGDIAYMDLSKDSSLFEGEATSEYQYEIYRMMRSMMCLDNPLADIEKRAAEAESSGRTWKGYHPQTNLVWLHFVLHKLLEQVEWPSVSKEPSRTKQVQKARWKRENDLEHVLLKVQSLLDPAELPASGLGSAGDLVALALGEGWLDVEDVVGLFPADQVAERGGEGNCS